MPTSGFRFNWKYLRIELFVLFFISFMIALLADLEAIAEAARQLFPIEEPPDDLWKKIQSKLDKE